MKSLVLLRHGESIWNKENRFTGWTDVALSEKGIKEAHRAGQIMTAEGFIFDVAFTSVLRRAIKTLWIVLEEMELMWIPVFRTWRLNERHYGALQELNKARTAEEFGEKQVHLWRRSYDVRPPDLERSDRRYPGNDPRYAGLSDEEIPRAECLRDTIERFLPCWHDEIAPVIRSGKRVLIAAHGNSLRALVKFLDGVPDDKIVDLNIPTGVPLVYELDDELKPLKHHYLGDPDEIRKATEAVRNQDKTKRR